MRWIEENDDPLKPKTIQKRLSCQYQWYSGANRFQSNPCTLVSQFHESLASQNLDLSWYVHICWSQLVFFASWGAAAYLEKCRPDYIEDSLFSLHKLQEAVLESQEVPLCTGRCALRAGSRWRGPLPWAKADLQWLDQDYVAAASLTSPMLSLSFYWS